MCVMCVVMCDDRGHCHFCCKKHTVSVFESNEAAHTLLQKSNVELAVLNTAYLHCFTKIEDFFKNFCNLPLPLERIIAKSAYIENPREEFTNRGISTSIDNLEISETSPVNKSIQIQSRNDVATFRTKVQTERTARFDKQDLIGGKRSVYSSDANIRYGTRVGVDCSQVRGNSRRTKKRQRPLTCDYCSKEFNHAGDFNKHRRTHTGEQPYTCDKCQQRFSHASNLTRHQRTHSGIRPFSCQTCGRTFTRKDKLTVHLTANRCGVKILKEKTTSVPQSDTV